MGANDRFFQAALACSLHVRAMEQNNRDIATAMFDRLNASDIGGLLDLMSEDATWLAAGKPERFPAAGSYDKPRLRKLFERMLARLDGGIQMRVLGTIAEGERVAVEAESSAELKNGRKYRQQYHFLVIVRAGKIAEVREYLDTQHAYDTWFAD
jgi:ketosteroid isomerase-like protein